MNKADNYVLALFGVNGAGKSTVAEWISERFGVTVAPKHPLGPARTLGHDVLVKALRFYAEQAAVIKRNASTRSSRRGSASWTLWCTRTRFAR